MDSSLATTYTLIHSFLRKHSHTKAALAVKKAAKDIVVLKDDIEIEGPYLDTIIKEWKASQVTATKSSSPDSSSGSDSENSSDSSDSDSSDPSDSSDSDDSSDSSDTSSTSKASAFKSKPAKGKDSKLPKSDEQVKTKVMSKATSSSDESSSDSSDSDGSSSSSSESDSESSDSDTKTTKSVQKLNETKVIGKAKVGRQSSQTLTSGSSSSSSASGSDRKTLKGDRTADKSDSSDAEKDANVNSEPKKRVASTSTPSDSDSSSEETKSKATKPKKNKKPSSSSSSSDSSSSDSDSSVDEDKSETVLETVKANKKHIPTSGGDETPARVTKKRRTTEDGAAVVTATTETLEPPKFGPQSSGRIKANGKPARKTNTPFKRVNLEKVDQQVLSQDNGYTAKAAPANDYGARAHQDLIVTRGAGFRKEKNKKKRGSYKGGTITLESHSFKFT